MCSARPHSRSVLPEHQQSDAQEVSVGADFTVGGEACRFPGDRRLSAGNRIRCRCTAASVFLGYAE